MILIKESSINSEKLFNLNELDYEKGVYTLFYNNKLINSDNELTIESVRIGIRSKYQINDVLVTPKPISSYTSDGVTPYASFTDLVTDLSSLLGFENGGGLGNGIVISQNKETYGDLVAGETDGDLAYVQSSQGTKWLPNNMGGTYYPSGWYVWNGTIWEADKNAIANQLEQNILTLNDKVNIVDLSTVGSTNDYNDLDNLPSVTNGIDGDSAYEVAVNNGFTGTEADWLLSLKGDQGIQGIQGVAGNDGLDGQATTFIFPIGGGFLLDPNEFNGWGATGVYDDVITHDLGNVGAAANRTSGGLCFPFKWRIKRFFAWHYNDSNLAEAWGWRINKQQKTANSNVVVNTEVLRECTGTGATAIAPRNYLSTQTKQTDIDLSSMDIVDELQVITLGVEAPTAVTTNRYVYITSGFFEIEKI